MCVGGGGVEIEKAFWAAIGRREIAGINSSGVSSGAGNPAIPAPPSSPAQFPLAVSLGQAQWSPS